MPAEPLTAFEREEIRAGIERGDSARVIGDCVGRHRCTISAEIGRNGGRLRYSAVNAQRRAERKRRRPKTPRLVTEPALARQVARRLKAKDSPKRISIELARAGIAQISHETIYQAIYNDEFGLEPGCHEGLHLKRRRRKRRGQAKQSPTHVFGSYLSIHDRPAIAQSRTEFGHLEGDQIVGAYNKSAIITVFDRYSRYLWLARLNSKGAQATLDAMLKLLARIPSRMRRTLTWDQGAEMACHAELSARRHVPIYIADPKSPWQRPTSENGNALVRRYVGKGTDLAAYTTRDLRHIEQRINTIPRPTLNWQTATDIYNHTVAMTN